MIEREILINGDTQICLYSHFRLLQSRMGRNKGRYEKMRSQFNESQFNANKETRECKPGAIGRVGVEERHICLYSCVRLLGSRRSERDEN